MSFVYASVIMNVSGGVFHIKQGTSKNVNFKNEKNGYFNLNSHNILDFQRFHTKVAVLLSNSLPEFILIKTKWIRYIKQGIPRGADNRTLSTIHSITLDEP